MQRASMIFNLALYTQEAGDLLECIANVATVVAERYKQVQLETSNSTCFLKEQLTQAKRSREASKLDQQLYKIKQLSD